MAGVDAIRQVGRIESDLDRAAQDAETENLRWECRALRSMLTNVNDDSETAGRLAQQCLAHDTQDTWITNVMLNVVSTAHLMAGRWESFYAVPPLILADQTGASTERYIFNLAYRLCYQGIAEYHQGRLDDAAALLEDAMRVGNGDSAAGNADADPASDRVIWALPAGLLAQVRYQQNRLAESAALIGECLELVKLAAPLDFAAAAFLTASRLANLEGNGARARTILEEAERLARTRAWPRMESAMLLERTRLCLIDGRLPESSACLTRLDALTAAASTAGVRKAYISRDTALAHAWMEIAQGTPERALPGLGRRLEAALSAGLPLEAARAGATIALAYLQANDRAGAIRLLREACDRVVRSNAVRVFFDLPVAPTSMQSLLRDCLESPAPHPALAKFMSHLADASRLPAPSVAEARQSVETLSGRERRILTLLAQGRSNKEIARALGVAPDTVKYHLKSVFSKLDVRNRVQAAAQAQSSGLS
jgi:LuxR family maltose regulon positive regulatory protein